VRQRGRHLQRVLVIQLAQHLVGKTDAIQLPERVIVAVVVEVFVVGFEDAPIVRVLVRLIAVFPEQDAILVLDEELARGARLAAEVVEHGRDVVVDVRVLVEQLAGAREVIRVPAEMRQDERVFGWRFIIALRSVISSSKRTPVW
jgi:hypothetical protein